MVSRPATSRRALVALAILACLILVMTAAGMGVNVFSIALFIAVLPLPLYVGLALWLDRYEPEPRGMLAMAFLWGASVAVLASGILNSVWDAAFGERIGTVAAGPITEEALKAVILLRFYVKRRDEFDGVIDGLIYAAMVGLGFACVENIDYYGRSLATEGMGGLAVTFTLRGVMAPFSHPLFTAMTGVGLGLARQTQRGWVRALAPVAGLLTAIVLHGLWNAGATQGCIFFAIYLFIMMPALAGVLVTVVFAWRREGRIIRDGLAGEVASGLLTDDERGRLCSMRGRLDALVRTVGHGGFDAWRRQRRRHKAASELAFLRHRVAAGLQAADPELEAEYLGVLTGDPEEGTGD